MPPIVFCRWLRLCLTSFFSSLIGPARRSISGRPSHSLIMIPGRRIYSLFRSQTTLTSSYACKQERAVQAVSFPRKKERNSVQEVGNRVLDHLHKNGEKCLHTFAGGGIFWSILALLLQK